MERRVELGRQSLSSGAAMGLSQAELAGLLGRPAGWVSLVAARTGDPAAAYEQLSWARNIAVRFAATGGSRDTGFGPAQIALYEIAVSAETSSPRGPRPTGDGAGPGQLHRAS